jgi:phage/plasmid primase-like uncharacterized protein
MRDGGDIHSLQFIGPDGGKRFLTGGRVTGCYFSIGNPKGAAALCIAEGFATGATIHEATGYPVAVAFNAGNLGAVAKTLRGKFPALLLILCGDVDRSGTGQKAATEAAQSVGGRSRSAGWRWPRCRTRREPACRCRCGRGSPWPPGRPGGICRRGWSGRRPPG